jgi:fibronectin-binding autotransporter adhesin
MDGGDPAVDQTARRFDLAGNALTIDRGLIIHVNQTQNIGNANTTTPARLTSGNSELIFVANAGTLDIGPGSYTATDSTTTSGTATPLNGEVIVSNNPGLDGIFGNTDDLAVSLVKSGAGTVELRNIVNGNSFTGGIFINQGTLRTFRGSGLGPNTNTITLNGGALEVHSEESSGTADDPIAGLGHNIVVNGNALIGADNGPGNAATNVNDNLNMGSLTITGPYVVQIGAFDGFDWSFTSANFAGTPIIDLGLNRGSATTDFSTTTINGELSGSGFRLIAGNTAANMGTLQLTGTTANTYTGEVTVYDTTMQLNKTAGMNAITGDLTVNGGTVNWLAANQMADGGDLTVNRGTVSFGGFAETINTLIMNGGFVNTGASTLAVTGDVTLRGTNNADGLQINSNAIVTVGGTLRILDFGKATLGGSGATMTSLTVGGLQMDGTILRMNAGAETVGNQLVLLGDVSTLPNVATAAIGNVDGQGDDAQTFINLDGVRTFDIANGGAGIDLLVKGVIRDNGATVGGLVKNGEGMLTMQGGGNANTYSGTTLVNAGTLELSKSAGTNAVPGNLTIGDGLGDARADRVVLRNSNQIADTAAVTVGSSGSLDLDTFNASETIASLSGSGAVDLGPGSILTINGASSTVYSGGIEGAGALVKDGSGTLDLTGSSEIAGGTTVNGTGKLLVNGVLGGSINLSAAAILGGSGTINGPIDVSGTLAPGNSPGDLTVNGPVTFNTGSSFSLELNSGTVGTGYDQLTIGSSGSVSITGGNITLSLGFAPAFGQQFTVIDNLGLGAIAGVFSNLANGGIITATYDFVSYDFVANYGGGTGNDLVLTVPEPTSATVFAVGLGLCAGLRRFRRRSSV